MLKNVIDLASILKCIEFVKKCSLITAEDKRHILREIKDFIPDERFCSGARKTREIIFKVLEAEINAGAKKASKAREETEVSAESAEK